nr:hypothetical protein [Bacteroidota bacterium]
MQRYPPATAANSGCPGISSNVNSCGTNSDGEMFVNYMGFTVTIIV